MLAATVVFIVILWAISRATQDAPLSPLARGMFVSVAVIFGYPTLAALSVSLMTGRHDQLLAIFVLLAAMGWGAIVGWSIARAGDDPFTFAMAGGIAALILTAAPVAILLL